MPATVPMTQIATENRIQPDGSTVQVTYQTFTNPEGGQTTVVLSEMPLEPTFAAVPIAEAVPVKEEIQDAKSP